MIKLPNECFSEIFYNLRADFKSLFSCLFVNRQWCRIVVPILWSEPTEYINNKKLIEMYLLALNPEEQTLLIPFKIILPNHSKLLFEYTSYTKSVGFDLTSGVIKWLNGEGYKINSDDIDERNVDKLISAVRCSLITMFIRTSKKLKYLTIHGNINKIIFKNLYTNTTLLDLSLNFDHFNSEEIKSSWF
ncbi:hypothetical protein F8M41_024705 [Gigaspora margarita]|uniref:F-box domain-containing protein n=1 Tax=Gigaspora margarita TaxID=4874 RepID=A0A8H3XJU9_GIGMA|nr:hypothetical protein F8M41_024705 [Gigaspora margarita]